MENKLSLKFIEVNNLSTPLDDSATRKDEAERYEKLKTLMKIVQIENKLGDDLAPLLIELSELTK